MPKSFNRVPANGITTAFAVPFPFLDRGHVYAAVDGGPRTFTWLSDGIVLISPAPAEGTVVKLYRRTPEGPIRALQNNSPNRDSVYNLLTLQALYRAEEAADLAADGVTRNAKEDQLSARGFLLEDLAPGEKSADAATRGQLDTEANSIRDQLDAEAESIRSELTSAVAPFIGLKGELEIAIERAEAINAFIEDTTEPWNLDLVEAYEEGWGDGTGIPIGGPGGADFIQDYENGKN